MNVVSHLDSNLILPKDIPLLTPDSIRSRVRGSKYVLVVEQSMIMTIWGCKICLLLMYNKLTFGLKQHLAVKIVGVYVVGNLILMEVLYFGVWCRPFNQYVCLLLFFASDLVLHVIFVVAFSTLQCFEVCVAICNYVRPSIYVSIGKLSYSIGHIVPRATEPICNTLLP